MVLNAVRIRAVCCSLATDKRRFHSTSSRMGFMPSLFHPDDQVPVVVNLAVGAGAQDRSGLALLDDGGAVKSCAGRKPVAVIHGGWDEAARFGKVCGALALEGRLSAGAAWRRNLQAQGGCRAGRHNAP